MTKRPAKIAFGWQLPTGKPRRPDDSNDYTKHIQLVAERITGSFSSLWLPDHFMDGDREIPEALVSLSYFAGILPDFQMGTAVIGQSYRNPALLAKMSATLQQMSEGRFILGLGAGWKEDEYEAYGYTYPNAATRITQLAETIQICRAMWDPAQFSSSFQGQHYRIKNAICLPKPEPPPPIMVGGGGEQLTLRVVAEHADWWNLPGATPEVYAHKLKVLDRYCGEINRDPDQIRKTWMGVVSIAPTQEAAVKQMENYPLWPGDTPLLGSPGAIRGQLRAYHNLGVDLFILAFVDEPSLIGLSLFIDQVVREL